MSRASESSSGGIGLFGLIAVLFIGLKLAEIIDWSWWLVLLPIYGPLAFVSAILAVVFVVVFIREVVK